MSFCNFVLRGASVTIISCYSQLILMHLWDIPNSCNLTSCNLCMAFKNKIGCPGYMFFSIPWLQLCYALMYKQIQYFIFIGKRRMEVRGHGVGPSLPLDVYHGLRRGYSWNLSPSTSSLWYRLAHWCVQLQSGPCLGWIEDTKSISVQWFTGQDIFCENVS